MSTALPYLLHKSATTALSAGAWLLILIGCQAPQKEKDTTPQEIRTADFELIIPAEQKALLILFPCFSCDAADTRSESKITDEATANGIAVMLMNFNRHIVMSDPERTAAIAVIEGAVKQHKVNASNTFIGGFSSGGNVTMLLARSLLASADPPVQLKGVFVVDSPIDLSHLYVASKLSLIHISEPTRPY